MRHLLAVGFLLSTAACTSVEPLRPDMETRPLPSRLDEIAYINGLRKAYYQINPGASVDGKVAPSDCYTGRDLKVFRPKFVQGYRMVDEQSEKVDSPVCLIFKPTKPTSALTDYLDNGYGLADLYCSRFMIIAAETRQARQIQKSTFNAVNVMVSTVLNAISAGANAMNVATGGFGLIDSTYKNIDDAFVITPEKDTLVRLVQAAQAAFRKEADATPPTSYANARARLERYSSICTYDALKGMVNTSVLLATQSLVEEKKDTPPTPQVPATPKTTTPPKTATPKVTAAPTVPTKPKPVTDALIPPSS